MRGESSTGDLLYVETSTDASDWTNRTILVDGTDIFKNGISGSYSEWVDASVDLGHLDGEPAVYFMFRFTPNGDWLTADGWYIDDVSVTAADTSYSNDESDYQFFSGTSMATSHVTGLAALIWAADDSLTYTQVKDRILNGVDVVSGLTGKVLMGGRINAYNSLSAWGLDPPDPPSEPPSGLGAEAASSSQINVSWTDHSSDESGFKIERKEESESNYTHIATVPADAESHSDTGLSAETAYTYRVRGFNSSGNSGYSDGASATTSASSGSSGEGGGSCFITTAASGLLSYLADL